jgi:transcriptional regulator with XRE-family HTH domain
MQQTSPRKKKMTLPSSIGARIKAIRYVAGISQNNLAQALGFSTRSLIGWEKDVTDPPLAVIRQLCRDYDVSSEWLLFGTDLIPTPFHGSADWARYDQLVAVIERASTDLGAEVAADRRENLARALYDAGEHGDAGTGRRLYHILMLVLGGEMRASDEVASPLTIAASSDDLSHGVGEPSSAHIGRGVAGSARTGRPGRASGGATGSEVGI